MSPKKRDVRSFQPEPDVAEMLDNAIAAGATLTELVNDALREAAPVVLKAIVKKHRDLADRVEKSISSNKR